MLFFLFYKVENISTHNFTSLRSCQITINCNCKQKPSSLKNIVSASSHSYQDLAVLDFKIIFLICLVKHGGYFKILLCVSLIKLEPIFMFIKYSSFLSPKLPNHNICSLFSWIYLPLFLLICMICLCTLALGLCRLCIIAKISKIVACILTF